MKLIKLFIEAYPISEDRMSGIGHMTLELVRALESHPDNQKIFEIVLVVNRDRRHKVERWGFKTVKVKTIPIPTRIFNGLWKHDLLPYMDLLLGKGHYIFPNYKNWRLLFSKSYTFVCDISYILFPDFVSPKNQQFLVKNVPKWVKRTDKVLAISQNAQKEITEHLHVDRSKVALVPCGVDRNVYFKRAKNQVENVKKTYSITGEYILYVGNIEPRKNISRLIKAYKLLPNSLRARYSLLLVGGGGWLNEGVLSEIAAAKQEGLNIITPDKYVPDEDLPALYSGATMLVHPALYEGFGISPLQAMACGTPVIVANNSSLPEVVGDAALLVNADNVEDISDKMRTVLSDKSLRGQLSTEGKLQVKKFSWDDSVNLLISEILGKS